MMAPTSLGSAPLTIVMYHYVRDLSATRWPTLKARDVAAFDGQLNWLAGQHEVVGVDRIIAAARGGDPLPANAAWLTFDDGYAEHFDLVMPRLAARGWQGSFFVPARPIREAHVLNVNKIHFLLATLSDPADLIAELRRLVDAARDGQRELPSWDNYVARYMGECHLDTPEVLFIKLMLQIGLPEDLRSKICTALFARFVTSDEAAFASELYMSVDQVRAMTAAGMHVGSHGWRHDWLSSLTRAEQEQDIDRSLHFLRDMGADTADWVMCYPYGGYNAETLSLLRERKCALALTTRSGPADLACDPLLELPRVDTIDLPCAA